MNTVSVGIIGCGNISENYVGNIRQWPILDLRACADVQVDRARAMAQRLGIARACTVDELLGDPGIQIVVNLTVPAAHAEVSLRAIRAGKHVVSEKPLAVTRAEGQQIMDEARQRNLRVGCAPDTFLGAGHQTARRLIDAGAIGRPVAATAFMLNRGPENWHPSPEFYFKPGGGPMFDMGPYYLVELLQCLGPVRRLSGVTAVGIPDRTIGSEPLRGRKISVETPDHVAGHLEFANGCIGTIITSFVASTPHTHLTDITIYGTEGTIQFPNPAGFDGAVLLFKRGEKEYVEAPQLHREGYGRGVGVADMAYALQSGRDHRASGERGLAMLDIMQGFMESAASGRAYEPTTAYVPPQALPTGLGPGELDL